MNPKKSLPQGVIDEWPEIFGEVTVSKLPLNYLEGIRLSFNEGKSWEINFSGPIKTHSEFTNNVVELLETYKDHISDVSIKLNTKKVRQDVERSIKKMLRKIKL